MRGGEGEGIFKPSSRHVSSLLGRIKEGRKEGRKDGKKEDRL